ncbi:hypothetical protein OG883_13970 [Streptomyces sp. NBC_01142]|nr:hypothetical protein [Streptomyces sp. NBC_01142]MCX4820999.1 hypothetical protein [Streptomyces sp. NBC_01142]
MPGTVPKSIPFTFLAVGVLFGREGRPTPLGQAFAEASWSAPTPTSHPGN